MSSNNRILYLFIAFVALIAMAFTLPRLAVGNDTGLAAGATAAIVFLGLLSLSLIIAAALFAIAIRNRKNITTQEKFAGFLPLPLLLLSALIIGFQIQNSKEEAPYTPPQITQPVTPTAP